MKTFKDLQFESHTAGEGKAGRLFFDNGYGVSVVRFELSGGFGYGSYTNNENEWELAVLFGDENDWDLTYNTSITDDVMGHLSENEVTEIMEKIQKLK